MSALRLIQWIAWAMDFTALIALYSTSEVHPLTAVFVLIILLFSMIIDLQFAKTISKICSSRFFFVGFTLLSISGAVVMWLKFHFPLIVGVASTAPLIHASLWLISSNSKLARTSQLRLALGFIDLIIASILTADVFLTLALFFFTLLAATSISCHFLVKATEENKAQLENLSSRYLISVIRTAFLVLLSAAILFPVLPRARVGGGLGAADVSHQVGYTEKVTLNHLSNIYGSRGGRVLLKILRPESKNITAEELSTSIHLGLIRMKSLDQFDGTRWSSSHRNYTKKQIYRHGNSKAPLTWIQIDREPIESEILPTPYGTEMIYSEEDEKVIHLTQNGEWVNTLAANRPTHYRVGIQNASTEINYGSGSADQPIYENLLVPQTLDTPALSRLQDSIFGNQNNYVKDPQLAASKIRMFFSDHKFSTFIENMESANPGVESRLPPLVDFLLVSRNGNCELFASASAVFMRKLGIPTRLITGFRISRSTKGGVLQIKAGDAHAWVEYWVDGKGWRVFDPTPRSTIDLKVWERFQEAYESLEGFWYHFAYSYDANAQGEISSKSIEAFKEVKSWTLSKDNWLNLLQRSEGVLKWIILLIGFILIFAILFFSFRLDSLMILFSSNKKNGNIRLQILRKRMERLVFKSLNLNLKEKNDLFNLEQAIQSKWGDATRLIYVSWKNHYLLARFGNSRDKLSEILAKIKSDESIFKKAT